MDPVPARDTLGHHILRHQHGLHPGTRGLFSALLVQIAGACKRIAAECRRAGLGAHAGGTGTVGHHGDEVKRLDSFAHDAFVRAFDHTGLAAALVSEEMEEPCVPAGAGSAGADYIVCFDPIDGSSNLEVDGTVGTIFSIRKRADATRAPKTADLLRPGTELLAAGYALYGPSCLLVLATKDGADLCTQDPETGEFVVTDRDLRIPPRGPAYGLNESNEGKWGAAERRLAAALRGGKVGEIRTARYAGALVADFHRTLLKGGLFCYPGEEKKPGGKIRVLYEAAPLAFVAEAAGGAASTGRGRILEVAPAAVHERTPIYIGSRDDVADAVKLLQG